MSCNENIVLSRRRFLGTGAATLALWGAMPRLGLAATRDPRLLVIVLRGGMDGLALAAPVGDPRYVGIRGSAALAANGPTPAMPLDNMFALNGAMPKLAELYRRREAIILHAIATPYRGRSHFTGQDILESGYGPNARHDDGWLNRALAGLPNEGAVAPRKGLSVGAVVPLVIRGSTQVLTWMPPVINSPLRESTVWRLSDLYSHLDPDIAKVFAESQNVESVGSGSGRNLAAAPVSDPSKPPASSPTAKPAQRSGAMKEFVAMAEVAARFLAQADGPRIGALSFNGWDTHANEGAISGQLATRLGGLDAAIDAFATGIGPAWKESAVVVVTEFGRTVRLNGTLGTDHGTATAALLVGGAVKGGRVIADWPGLADNALFEGRDLAPTRDLRSVLKGVLRDHIGVSNGALARVVFPESDKAPTLEGLFG